MIGWAAEWREGWSEKPRLASTRRRRPARWSLHGEHRRVGGRQNARQEIPQPLGIDLTAGQGGIDPTPAALVDRLQAQGRQGHKRCLGAQQRIAQLKQRIGAAGAAGMQLSPERAQPHQGKVGLGWPPSLTEPSTDSQPDQRKPSPG